MNLLRKGNVLFDYKLFPEKFKMEYENNIYPKFGLTLAKDNKDNSNKNRNNYNKDYCNLINKLNEKDIEPGSHNSNNSPNFNATMNTL